MLCVIYNLLNLPHQNFVFILFYIISFNVCQNNYIILYLIQGSCGRSDLYFGEEVEQFPCGLPSNFV